MYVHLGLDRTNIVFANNSPILQRYRQDSFTLSAIKRVLLTYIETG